MSQKHHQPGESERTWSELSPDEKREFRFQSWLDPDITFVSAEAAQVYRERVVRFIQAITLEETPDRVPVCTVMGFFPAFHAGLSPYDSMHDMERASEAWFQYNVEFQPDAAVSPALYTVPANALEVLDLRNYSWPGHGVSHEFGYQYHDGEFMFAGEYDELIADPSFFMQRRVLPRVVGAYAGLAHMESPFDMRGIGACPAHVARWGTPEMQESLEKLMDAGRQMRHWTAALDEVSIRIKAEGFPSLTAVTVEAPFDMIADTLRGTRGMMLDLYRLPEKVMEACDRLVDVLFLSVLNKTTPNSIPGVFIPLHKGLDNFMSSDHFNTFYWPSLRKLVIKLIEEGFVPWLFTEGRYDSRLETISDVPKGKVVYWLNTTDIFRAKQILGATGCIQGNVPVSMMTTCEPEEVEQYCRRLIDKVGEGGGFILDLGAGPDRARAENIHAMVRTAKEYKATWQLQECKERPKGMG